MKERRFNPGAASVGSLGGCREYWIQKHLDRFGAVNPGQAGHLLFPSPLWVFFSACPLRLIDCPMGANYPNVAAVL